MLIDDGRGIDEPVDWDNIRSLDELRVYERAIVQPDYSSLYNYDPRDPVRKTTPKFGMPEFYHVFSTFGSFTVHESRCLIFRNGILPEYVTQPFYRFWGMPEYIKIKRALRETITAHGDGVKLLERSVQAICKMKNLAQLLTTDEGEDQVLKRLQVIDAARGILNSIAIDNEGEDYDFKTLQLSGVKDVLDATCNMLSALTSIPQTILFGRSPAGQNSTGESDLENWYNFIERIQKLMLKGNTRTVLDVLFRAGVAQGGIEKVPSYKLKFNPLWSLNDTEQATVEQTKAQTSYARAQTAQIYVDMQALDPSEVRQALAKNDEFTIEEILDTEDEPMTWGLENVPEQEPELPIDELEATIEWTGMQKDGIDCTSSAVLVERDGKFLVGNRRDGTGWCGPGGHIEDGETPEQAARREANEEFGIQLGDMMPVGKMTGLPEKYGVPFIFFTDDFEGSPSCDGDELMRPASFEDVEYLLHGVDLFIPFGLSLKRFLLEIGRGGT